MSDRASTAVVARANTKAPPADQTTAVLRCLVDADGAGLTPGELDRVLPCSPSARKRAVVSLVSRGLATRQSERGRIRATAAGRTALHQADTVEWRPEPRGTVADLEGAVALLPTAAHRATFRLLLDAIVARWHLRGAEPSGWPSFVLAGPTKSAKTLLGLGACRVFGLDPALVVRSLPTETERSLWGRRYQLAGGAWALRSAPVLDLPLLVLDEADKAANEVRRASLRLLQGEARVPGEEGEVVTVAPVALVTANGGADVVPDEYRRRAVVLDTTSLIGQLDDLHRLAPAFLNALPVLDLDAFEVPALAASVLGELVPQLRAGLSERGWRLADERALSRLVAGRVALCRCEASAAVASVAGDYLDTAETVGETPTAPGPLEPAPHAAERRRVAEVEQVRQREARRRARAEDIELRGVVGQLVDGLRQVRPDLASFDPSYRPQAALMAGRIDALIAQAEEADTLDDLREVTEDGRKVFEEAAALASEGRPPLPAANAPASKVIDVESVDDDEGYWWCNDCRREFAEPETPRWWSRYRCPHCGGAGIEWVEPEPADAEAGESDASEPVVSGPVVASLVGWRDCYIIRAECGHLLAGKVSPPGGTLPRTPWAWCDRCRRTVNHGGWWHEHGSRVPAHAVAGWLVEDELGTSIVAELSPAPVLRTVLGR